MSKVYTLYDQTSGAILSVARIVDSMLAHYAARNIGLIEGRYPSNAYYVDISADPPAPVPLMTMGLTISDYRIDNIPPGSIVTIDFARTEVSDGFIELSNDLDLPEDVRVKVRHPLYHDEEVMVPCP